MRFLSFLASTVIVFSLLSGVAFAGQAKFGPEFNFSNPKLSKAARAIRPKPGEPTIIQTDKNLAAQKEFGARVAKKCPTCKLQMVRDRYGIEVFEFTHENGWKFWVALDPAVVEVQMTPMTADEAEKEESEIQRLIFDTASEIGLRPGYENPGQIHIGILSAFGKNALLFRNFIVDMTIHSKLFYNLFDGNTVNSPRVDQIGPGSEENLRQIVKAFDESDVWKPNRGGNRFTAAMKDLWAHLKRQQVDQSLDGAFKATPRSLAIFDMAKAITDYVYFQSMQRTIGMVKFQFLNIMRMFLPKKDQTVEWRSAPEVESARQFTILTRWLQSRLDYLGTKKEPIPFSRMESYQSEREEALAFRDHVKESDGPWPAAGGLMSDAHLRRARDLMRAPTCEDFFGIKKVSGARAS